jgi:hypothetical protein
MGEAARQRASKRKMNILAPQQAIKKVVVTELLENYLNQPVT